jgi:hypothetical protein
VLARCEEGWLGNREGFPVWPEYHGREATPADLHNYDLLSTVEDLVDEGRIWAMAGGGKEWELLVHGL